MPMEWPRAPLPPPICSDQPGTWAYDTLTRRIRTEILARVWRENDFFDTDTVASLQVLSNELEAAKESVLTPIPNDGGPDWEKWKAILSNYVGRYTWLTAPYCLAEFYFYRRLMVAVHWFRDRRDPFQKQKELGIQGSLETMFSLLRRLKGIGVVQNDKERGKLELISFLFLSLWGNRLDLSLWPSVSETEEADTQRKLYQFVEQTTTESNKLLANDSDKVFQYLYSSLMRKTGSTRRRVDIVVDNAGLELFCDMCFAHYLIQSGVADEILFHLKAHPLFVSDAMEKDFLYTIRYLEEMTMDKPEWLSILKQWREYLQTGQWRTLEDYFWCQPCAFWEMPNSIRQDWRDNCLLVIVKGDANYRRLLGDLNWDKNTPFEDIVNYFPTAICALRTLKSEILCGVSTENQEYAKSEDPRWMVSGEWAVVQFYRGE
ncbi:hypothetical protein GpartN1_g3377.t1 [Galdieria partita]|uniref:Sugar phosphate phosphatase n=1 Tax=Galdieria partita TaxID=83374 RepID=A0A9C7PW41_9RHOD|nr:hypothetical protein GpartN1_g3377.t1 [Galdieria partita]